LTIVKAASPAAVARSLPKYCADVQMRASFMAVRKFEVRYSVDFNNQQNPTG
jgi:hypothetical protein